MLRGTAGAGSCRPGRPSGRLSFARPCPSRSPLFPTGRAIPLRFTQRPRVRHTPTTAVPLQPVQHHALVQHALPAALPRLLPAKLSRGGPRARPRPPLPQSVQFALIPTVHTFSPSSPPHRLPSPRLCPLRSDLSSTLPPFPHVAYQHPHCRCATSKSTNRNPLLFRDSCFAPSCQLYPHVLRQRAGPLSAVGISNFLVL